jgi:DnaJ-class molecular chaperone
VSEVDFVKQYAESMKITMQQRGSRLGGVPEMVRCNRCAGKGQMLISLNVNKTAPCYKCESTGRVPIPWAEVMNVR